MDDLIGTVERLLETSDERAPQIRADLERLNAAREYLAKEWN